MPDDSLCTRCQHPRSDHEDEMPYECFALCDDDEFCECISFSYVSRSEAE